ncbi:uncharacterized protein LOC131165583 [Malania oleifera]|uniref:uncharacterized protein LOC131165583 n=1 Tax=Malania oleifera TaxID=397392 RepID=UPI0025AE9591|nr:uncharacterized protein LOC131165583 [Malania oleifera]
MYSSPSSQNKIMTLPLAFLLILSPFDLSRRSSLPMRKLKGFSCSFLLILLLTDLFAQSSLAIRELQDLGIDKVRELTIGFLDELSVEGDKVQRKELHEVHSGPNPIGN